MTFRPPILLAALFLASSLPAAELGIVSPADGSTVPTLKAGQKAYLKMSRKARFASIDDPALRQELLRVGSAPEPVMLEWTGGAGGETELSVVALPEGEESTFTLTNVTSVYLTNLELGREYRWMVRDAESSATAAFRTESVPPRNLRAAGVSNFRDLGGWTAAGGRKVKSDLIFRSAGLRGSSRKVGGAMFAPKYEAGELRATPEGLATLKDEFKVKTDLELRSVQECAGMTGSVVPGARWVHVPFAAYDFIDNMARGREPFAKIFHVFADKANYPVLMHCSGGRDRTGTVAFILLGLLGVAEEDLLRDWEFSVFSDAGAKFNSSRITRLLDYLHALPGADLRAKVETYVRGCGVTDAEIAAFRAIMLEGGEAK